MTQNYSEVRVSDKRLVTSTYQKSPRPTADPQQLMNERVKKRTSDWDSGK
jgi:hypothetical protein